MQTPTQVPGQVLSQVARVPQQNGSASAGTGLTWPRWQSDQDTGLRRRIVDNILQLFKNRKPHVTPEWQQKLPDFVKRLEEALYKNAPSKDEYADLKTLEQRLQSVARRMVPKQPPNSVGSSAPSGNMISMPGAGSSMISAPGNGSSMMPTPGAVTSMLPTPGNLSQPGAGVAGCLNNMMPTPGTNNLLNTVTHGAGTMMPTAGALSNMMPTPGHSNMYNMSGSNIVPTPGVSGPSFTLVSQQAMGSLRMAQNGHVPCSMGVPVGSQMIPTPGLSTSQALGMTPASCSGLGISNVGVVGASQLQHQTQQFGVGSGNQMFSGINGQLGGGHASGVQQQRKPGVGNGGMSNGMILSNGQHVMNGTATLHASSAYLSTSQYSSVQLQQQQQQRMCQQHPQQQQQQQQQHQLQLQLPLQHQLQHPQQQQQLLHQPQPQQQQRSQNMRGQSGLSNSLVSVVGDGYAMNAADLAGGSFPSGSLASNNLAAVSISNSPAPKMIPVPGLSSQQNLHQQQVNLQQQVQQRNNLQQQSNNGLTLRNQQQHLGQQPSNQNLYQSQGQQLSAMGGQKQAGVLWHRRLDC